MHLFSLALLFNSFIGRKKAKAFSGFYNVIEIKHYIPGRMRLYVPSLKGNEDKLQNLNTHLPKLKAVKKFEVNTMIGSVLLIYDQEQLQDQILFGIMVKLLGLEDQINSRIPSRMSQEMNKLEENINQSLFQESKGIVDLRSLTTMFFLFYGLKGLLTKAKNKPSPYTLLYWAYKGFLHDHK